MVDLPADVLQLAEDLNAHMPQRPSDRRLVTSRYVISMAEQPGPHGTVVQRLRLRPAEVEGTVAEVRAFLRREGRTEATWELGPSATPHDLLARLGALGMEPFELEPRTVGMVFSPPADAAPAAWDAPAVEITLVGRSDRRAFVRSQEVFWSCFGFRPDTDPDQVLEKDFLSYSGAPHWLRYVAWRGGEPVAVGDAALTPAGVVLCGGATLQQERGSGLYRALLVARLREAVARGTPRLITQAGRMSRPILRRLGFREVAAIDILHDRLPR